MCVQHLYSSTSLDVTLNTSIIDRVAVCFQWVFKQCDSDIDLLRPHPNAPVVPFPVSARPTTSQPPVQVVPSNASGAQQIASTLPPPNTQQVMSDPGPSRQHPQPAASIRTPIGSSSAQNKPILPMLAARARPPSNPPQQSFVTAPTPALPKPTPAPPPPIQLIPKDISGAGVPKGFWASLEKTKAQPSQPRASPQPTANSGFVVMNPDEDDSSAPNWTTTSQDSTNALGEDNDENKEDEDEDEDEDELDELADDDQMDTAWHSSALRASPALGVFGSLSRVQADEKRASAPRELSGTPSASSTFKTLFFGSAKKLIVDAHSFRYAATSASLCRRSFGSTRFGDPTHV